MKSKYFWEVNLTDHILRKIQNLEGAWKHSISSSYNQNPFKVHQENKEQLQTALKDALEFIWTFSSSGKHRVVFTKTKE